MNAYPKRTDIAHEVHLSKPHLGMGVDPTTIVNEVYACVSPEFAITPSEISVIKSDNLGQSRLNVSVLNGIGMLAFTATGYSTRFENLLGDEQINYVLKRIKRFSQNITKVQTYQDHRYCSLQFGTWYTIRGGQPEIDVLLKSLHPVDNSFRKQQIGATDSWIPTYRRAYRNQDENWLLTVSLEPSASDFNDLFYSILAHYYQQPLDWDVSKMVTHTLSVRENILESFGIEVGHA